VISGADRLRAPSGSRVRAVGLVAGRSDRGCDVVECRACTSVGGNGECQLHFWVESSGEIEDRIARVASQLRFPPELVAPIDFRTEERRPAGGRSAVPCVG
jgi:hypothetical protein